MGDADIDLIAEEIESMGKGDKRELVKSAESPARPSAQMAVPQPTMGINTQAPS